MPPTMSSNSSTPTPTPSDASNIYAAVEAYPWDSDPEFQSGLSAILGASTPAPQAAELALRARCFYYARKYATPLDFNAYKAYREAHGLPALSTDGVKPLTTATGLEVDVQPAEPVQTTSHGAAEPNDTQEAPQPTQDGKAENKEEAPYPTTFAHIVSLITSGQPVPGIREIPDTVLEGQGTASVVGARRKPWEKGRSEAGGKEEGGEGGESTRDGVVV